MDEIEIKSMPPPDIAKNDPGPPRLQKIIDNLRTYMDDFANLLNISPWVKTTKHNQDTNKLLIDTNIKKAMTGNTNNSQLVNQNQQLLQQNQNLTTALKTKTEEADEWEKQYYLLKAQYDGVGFRGGS